MYAKADMAHLWNIWYHLSSWIYRTEGEPVGFLNGVTALAIAPSLIATQIKWKNNGISPISASWGKICDHVLLVVLFEGKPKEFLYNLVACFGHVFKWTLKPFRSVLCLIVLDMLYACIMCVSHHHVITPQKTSAVSFLWVFMPEMLFHCFLCRFYKHF